ncbi:hypothetical protein NKR23_g12345 [Pleurostoma richardsiae]|uniref:Prion-inhibition and propagation HeLo domain-containing protein n=1 Tax=Pleurostoma richardsiae TaxID=41990 RepID=A0AA38REP0_9PEZI|nr:hypothetical protein NKR23_g12345 [Pleurostoma richardsiae]
MEPVGLAVGIVGLVGLFSTCLEVIDKVQYYKTFANDSHVLDSQFNAEKLRFEQWGRAVGLAPGTPSANHHDALDEPDVRAVVGDILSIVRSIYTADSSSRGAIAHSNIRTGRYDMPSAGQGPLDGVYSDSVQKRLEGTCDWVLSRDIFLRWLSPKVETTKLLWINAPAGFGKTILCAHIVEHLSATMDKPVGHFFFSSDHESRGDQFVAVRSWIAQVMSRNQDAFSLARDAWTAQQEQMTTVATRRDIVKLFGNVIIKEAVENTDTRFLVVSRDELEIRQALMVNSPNVAELKILPEDVQADTASYSQYIVNTRLCQFLWLKMQGEFLSRGKNKKQLQAVIDETPAGLGTIYMRNWERIERFSETKRARAFSLLQWTAFSWRRLTISEITEAVLVDQFGNLPMDELPDSVDEDYINSEILDLCAPLLEVRAGSICWTDSQPKGIPLKLGIVPAR